MLPKRPRQHQLEDEARTAFRALLPSRFVFRSEHDDYGIDGEVEEFDRDERATGLRFRVQLKGTDKTGEPSMRERIKLTTAAYYRAQQIPVLMVRYSSETRQLYGRWFHEFDPYYEHVGKKHLTFHWSETDLLTEQRFDEIFGQVARIIRLKSAGLQLPLAVYLEVPSAGAHALARAEIEVAFDTSISRCTGVLERAEAGTAADVTLAVDDDEIRANLAGLASVTFHVPSEVYSSENGPKELAAETLSCAAVALARAGHGDPAARVAVEFFAESVFVAVPPLAAELAAAMAQAGRVVEVVEIAERLDQDTQDARRAAGAVFMTITRERTHALRPHEHQTFEAALRARLNRRLRAGESKEAAAAAENLGVYLTQARRPWDAIEPLEQCMALEPRRQSAGLVAHLAGAYFLSGRWSDSVLAYEQALDLAHERDPWLETRRADALLYAGRYREALQAFRQHVESEDLELAAWAYSKARAIEWIVKTTGIEMQDPDPDAANQLAARWPEVDSPEGQDQLASDVWRRDAASSLGWFNRARDLLDRGRESEAMHAYLTAAVMREGDVEAWVNVALLAVNTRDDDLFFASVLTGHRLNPESYMNEFSRQLRATSEDLAFRDEILQGVREVTRTTDEDNGAVVSNVR